MAEPRRVLSRGAVGAVSLWWKPTHRPRLLVAQRGTPAADASFIQVNSAVGERLHAYVLERTRRIARTWSSTRTPARARRRFRSRSGGARVVAIESDREAVATTARRDCPTDRAQSPARVEDVLAQRCPPTSCSSIRRASASTSRSRRRSQAATTAPRAVIYVSCDPATLARDLARMPRYRIASLRSFDMFPQTAHVETVCELRVRERSAMKYLVRIGAEDHDGPARRRGRAHRRRGRRRARRADRRHAGPHGDGRQRSASRRRAPPARAAGSTRSGSTAIGSTSRRSTSARGRFAICPAVRLGRAVPRRSRRRCRD